MAKRLMASVLGAIFGTVFSLVMLAPTAHAQQTASAQQAPAPAARNQSAAPAAVWNSLSIPPTGKPAASGSAPRRDISGVWDAFGAGIQPNGVKSHAPFTPWGQKMANTYKPGDGPRKVTLGQINDPLDGCDPAGFPRQLFFELRPVKIAQIPDQVLMLYEYQKVWRVIWTDGRALPKDPEPRWYGYSVGHWDGDDTFVVETVGLDERTWLDNAGDPHSGDMRVEERYHRADRDTLEVTVKIDDPKAYTAPWLGLDKFPLHLQPASFDIREMICVPSEAQAYKEEVADPASK
jgi:hypothetical protein